MQENFTEEEMLRKKIAQRLDFVINNLFDGRNVNLSRATNGKITESAISRWRKGLSLPDARTIVAIQEEAGISLDYIMKGITPVFAANASGEHQKILEELWGKGRSPDLINRNAEIIESTATSYDTKYEVASMIRKVTENSAQPLQPEKSNIGSPISLLDSKGIIRVFMTPANAGRGFALDDMPDAQDARPLFTNNGDIIVVPVSGNSMEPVIMDGDKVYVDTSRKEPRFGEIVLCNVDGVNYVKYYIKKEDGKVYLASSNTEYEPMRINGFNNSRVYGVVIQISRTPERANPQDFIIPEQ